MNREEKLKLTDNALQQAEAHCESMRLSYLVAKAQVDCLKREAKSCEGPWIAQEPDAG